MTDHMVPFTYWNWGVYGPSTSERDAIGMHHAVMLMSNSYFRAVGSYPDLDAAIQLPNYQGYYSCALCEWNVN